MPGIGAQGGDILDATQEAKTTPGSPDGPGFLLHLTRGVLPTDQDKGDPFGVIRAKVLDFQKQTNKALHHAGTP